MDVLLSRDKSGGTLPLLASG